MTPEILAQLALGGFLLVYLLAVLAGDALANAIKRRRA